MKVLRRDGSIYEGSFEEKEVREAFWHTSAHVLAQAVKRLYPDTKCAIGPAISNGFYYDFDFGVPFSEEQLKDVENYRRSPAAGGLRKGKAGSGCFYGREEGTL